MDIRNRIQQLLTAINQGVYEKDTELSLSLLAALAGESVTVHHFVRKRRSSFPT